MKVQTKHHEARKDTRSAGVYDSANRLRQYQRGTLSTTNGYLNQGGGSITAPIALPDTDTQRTYDLDGLGNWKHTDYTPVGGTSTQDLRQHNKLNEITSRRIGGAGVSPAIFSYDGQPGASNGNLADDGTLLYSYDALNRLIEVKRKSDGAVIGQYVYDTLNRRISKTVSNGGLSGDLPNGTTVYLYNNNWQVIEERDGSDTTAKQYVWGEYIDELIQMKTAVTSGGAELPAGDYYPLQDLLYRNTALTDATGAIVETYDTDAYGNTLIFKAAGTGGNWWADDAVQTDNPACEIIYAGYRYEPESELYYVRHRTYNPSLGRWVQRDPLGYVDAWNLYIYVRSNGVRYIDFKGYSIFSDIVDVFKAAGSGVASAAEAVGSGIVSGAEAVKNFATNPETEGVLEGAGEIALGGVVAAIGAYAAIQSGGLSAVATGSIITVSGGLIGAGEAQIAVSIAGHAHATDQFANTLPGFTAQAIAKASGMTGADAEIVGSIFDIITGGAIPESSVKSINTINSIRELIEKVKTVIELYDANMKNHKHPHNNLNCS